MPGRRAGAAGCRRRAGAWRSGGRSSCGDDGVAAQRAVGADRQREAEPARLASSAWPRAATKTSSRSASPSRSRAKFALRAAMKPSSLSSCADADRRLHVGDLQVVADVRVGVLVVVAVRAASPNCRSKRLPQVLSLPGSHQQSRPQSRKDSTRRLSRPLLADDRAAFAHRDVVRRVEADGGEVAERADRLAVVRRADRVAAVLDQPQIVLARRTP